MPVILSKQLKSRTEMCAAHGDITIEIPLEDTEYRPPPHLQQQHQAPTPHAVEQSSSNTRHDFLSALPNEILNEIIEYIAHDSTTNQLNRIPLITLRQVNRRFQTLSDSDAFWSRLFNQSFPGPFPYRNVFHSWHEAFLYQHARHQGHLNASPLQRTMRRDYDILWVITLIYVNSVFAMTLTLPNWTARALSFAFMNMFLLLIPVYDYCESIFATSPDTQWSIRGYLQFGIKNLRFKSWWAFWLALLGLSLVAVLVGDSNQALWVKILMGFNYPIFGVFVGFMVFYIVKIVRFGFGGG